MKTLADLKRAMVVGSMWEATVLDGARFKTWRGTTQTTLTRTVLKAQTNGVYLSLPTGEPSFLSFGKASDWIFDGDRATLLNEQKLPLIRYEWLPF